MLINERFAADLAKADAVAESISSLMVSLRERKRDRERELHLRRACQRVVLLRADMHERFQQKGTPWHTRLIIMTGTLYSDNCIWITYVN